MKKTIFRVFVGIYIVIAVFTTVSLLTYKNNEQKLSEFNNKVFVKLQEDVQSYRKGSLLIIDKNNNYQAGDNVFYCNLKKNKCIVTYGTVDTMMGDAPTVNNEIVSAKLIIGKDENVRVIPVLGGIMNTLESRWGFLCIIVLPILIGFLYELYNIIKEMKKKK